MPARFGGISHIAARHVACNCVWTVDWVRDAERFVKDVRATLCQSRKMSRNCRRSHPDIAKSSEEEDPAFPVEQYANSETRLQSRSLSSRELVCRNDTGRAANRGQPLQRLVAAEGTEESSEEASRTFLYSTRSPSTHQHFPQILVEASMDTKGRDSDAKVPEEADDRPVRSYITEPISELPFFEPKSTQPNLPIRSRDSTASVATENPEPSWAESVWASVTRLLSFASLWPKSESSLDEERKQSEISLSEKDEYDREEPLVTKTQKYYKKRPTLISVYDESEESLRVSLESQNEKLSRRDTIPYSVDTESPGMLSDYTAERRSEGRLETPSSTEELFSPGSYDLGGLHLREGMVFIYMVIPPDGGYGWVIMVLSFLCQLIVDGIILTIGSILPDIEREFKVRDAVMVFVASVQIGCYFLSGAFSSILINRFAFRPVAISGAILSILAFVAGSFSPTLVVLILLYSAIGGCSLSLIWCSSQLIVACYFERYRPLANGFSCSGAGAGTIIFSLLNNWLVPIIGWRNMLRVQAGAIFLVMLMAIAYVEVRPVQVGVLPENTLDSSPEEYYGNFYVHDYLRASPANTSSKSLLSLYDPTEDQSKCCPCCKRCKQRRRDRKSLERREKEHNLLIRTSYIERDDLFYTGPADYADPHSKENIEGKEIHLVGTDKNTQQVNYGIQHIQKGDNRRSTPEAIERVPRRQPPRKRCAGCKCRRILARLFDYHLFKQFEFLILVASALLYPMGFNIPFVYSKARTTIHKDYAALITPAIGLTNFAFRIICGFVAFKRRNWTRNICGGGLVFGGCFVFASAFFGQNLVWFQILYGLCYGVAPAVYSTLRAIIYVRYLGLSKLTNAFGITALAMGIGVFAGTTIAGMLVGASYNYEAAFIFAGLCLMISGMLKLLLPLMVKFHDRQRSRRRATVRKSTRKTVR